MSRAAAEVLTTRHGVAFSVEHVGAPATASAIDSILFVHATGLCKVRGMGGLWTQTLALSWWAAYFRGVGPL